MAAFGETPDFNALETSKVRVAASDLRQRLAAYGEHEGANDLVAIVLPLNTYVPEFRDRRAVVTIADFENWHPHAAEEHLCKVISSEIAYQLTQSGIRAILPGSPELGVGSRRYALRGSVESRDERLRINASLSDPVTGRIVCSRSTEATRDDLIRLTRDVTRALLATLRSSASPGVGVHVRSHRRS